MLETPFCQQLDAFEESRDSILNKPKTKQTNKKTHKLSTITISRKKCSIMIPRVRNVTIPAIDPMGHVSGLKWTGNWSERAGRQKTTLGIFQVNWDIQLVQ